MSAKDSKTIFVYQMQGETKHLVRQVPFSLDAYRVEMQSADMHNRHRTGPHADGRLRVETA